MFKTPFGLFLLAFVGAAVLLGVAQPKWQTVRLHIDGFSKSKSGAI
jgi:hypothetical protein